MQGYGQSHMLLTVYLSINRRLRELFLRNNNWWMHNSNILVLKAHSRNS